MAKEVPNTILYQVKPQTPVTLTVTVGNANVGGSRVTYKGATLAENGVTDVSIPAPADPNKDLKGRTARCSTHVQRTNQSSSHCSVEYDLQGGVADKRYTVETTLEQLGDLADFSTTIVFE